MYKRPLYQTLQSRLKEPRRFLQVLAGPRQVGKTTLARQAMEGGRTRSHYASADEPTLQDRAWIEHATLRMALDDWTEVPAFVTLVPILAALSHLGN